MKAKAIKIIITGEAGNGVNYLAKKLCDLVLANEPKKSISYYFEYDSAVRGGNTVAYLFLSNGDLKENFVFEQSDMLLSFRKEGCDKFKAEEYIGCTEEENGIDFRKEAEQNFKNTRQANIIALGYLANKLELTNHDEVIEPHLKQSYRHGYKLAQNT